VAISIFPSGLTLVKFYFTKSKLRENQFSNFKIQGIQDPPAPLPTPMQMIYVHIRKTRLSYNKLTRLPHKFGLCNRNPNFRLRLHNVKFLASAPAVIIQNCFGSGTDSTGHLSVSSIIIQWLHCSFCAMYCSHVFCLLIFVAKQQKIFAIFVC